MLKIIFRCQRKAFGYAENKTWTTRKEGIWIPKEGIRMLKIVSECQRKAFEYAKEGVSGCWKRHPDTWGKLSGYAKEASGYAATGTQEQRRKQQLKLEKLLQSLR